MNSTEISPEHWHVTNASHTLVSSFYLVERCSSKEMVKVTVSNKNRRHYFWLDLSRAKEEIPDEVRREIDRALIRYLSAPAR